MKPCTWDSIQYPSKSIAARAIGISKSAMFSRLNKGYTCATDMIGHVIWNGIGYGSIVAAARANKCGATAMSRRLKMGYTCDSDMSRGRKRTLWNGIQYPSQSAAARALGVSKTTLYRWLRKSYAYNSDRLRKTKENPEPQYILSSNDIVEIKSARKRGVKTQVLAELYAQPLANIGLALSA